MTTPVDEPRSGQAVDLSSESHHPRAAHTLRMMLPAISQEAAP
jgi:hypothetical protein